MKIFLCPAWQILIIRNIFPPWEQIKTFQIQQSFEKSLHSANCQRCVKATLTLLLIYFRGIIRVIMKIEMREIKFSWGVIAWDFLLIFYFIKIESKWLGKVSFRAKNQKRYVRWRYLDSFGKLWDFWQFSNILLHWVLFLDLFMDLYFGLHPASGSM